MSDVSAVKDVTELPQLPKRRSLEKLLLHLEFKKIGQLKNHAIYKHDDGRLTTVPGYRGKRLAFTLLKLILKEINLTAPQYNELIKGWD